jgi:hypothetical protein
MQTGLWRGVDWRGLTSDAQWAYEMLCQQDALSYAGIIDYRAGRFAALAKDLTARKVEAAIRELEAARFVIIDRETEELLVRTEATPGGGAHSLTDCWCGEVHRREDFL